MASIPAFTLRDVAGYDVLADNGAEGVIHRVPVDEQRRHQLGQLPWPLVAKRYREPRPIADQQRLTRNIIWFWDLTVSEWLRFTAHIAWPIAPVLDEHRQVCGIVMRDLTADFGVPYTPPGGSPGTMTVHLRHCLQDDDYLQTHFGHPRRLDDRTRVEILQAICDCVAIAHQYRIVINDYSENNVVLRLHTDEVQACLIDADCMGRQGDIVDPLVTEFWGAPEGRDSLTSEADVYRVGRTALCLFARRRRVRNSEAPTLLPSALIEVATSSLAKSPLLRPAIGEWEVATGECLRKMPHGAPLAAAARPAAGPQAAAAVAPPPVGLQAPLGRQGGGPAPSPAPPRGVAAPQPNPSPRPAPPPARTPTPAPTSFAGYLAPQPSAVVHPRPSILSWVILFVFAGALGYAAGVAGAYIDMLAAAVAIGLIVSAVAWLLAQNRASGQGSPARALVVVTPLLAFGVFAGSSLLHAQERALPLFPENYGPIAEVQRLSVRNADNRGAQRRPTPGRAVRAPVCPGTARIIVARYRVPVSTLVDDVNVRLLDPKGLTTHLVRNEHLGGKSMRVIFRFRGGSPSTPFPPGRYRLIISPEGEWGNLETVVQRLQIINAPSACG